MYIYCGYALLTFLSCLWSFDQSLSTIRSYTYIEFALLIYISGCIRSKEEDKQLLKKALIWSSRFTAILLLLIGEYYEDRLTFMGTFDEDPNYLCMYFSFGIIGALEKTLKSDHYKKNLILSLFELLAYIYIVLLTGSRGGLIAIIASICAFVILERNKISKSRLLLLYLLFGSVSFYIVTHLSNIVSFSERYTLDEVISSGGTGRVDIWDFGWKTFLDFNNFNKFFGSGIATTNYLFSIHGFKIKVMHNIFLETLVEIGIVGIILYTYMICSFLIASYKNKNYYSFSILIGFIVLSLSTSLSTFKPYLNIMIFIVILTSTNKGTGTTQAQNTPSNQQT